jgi:hypothetical protein
MPTAACAWLRYILIYQHADGHIFSRTTSTLPYGHIGRYQEPALILFTGRRFGPCPGRYARTHRGYPAITSKQTTNHGIGDVGSGC